MSVETVPGVQPVGPEPLAVTMLGPPGLEPEGVARALASASIAVAGPFHDLQPFLAALTGHSQVALLWCGDQEDPVGPLEALRSVEPRARALVLSTQRSDELARRCYAAGAGAFLDATSSNLAAVVGAVRSLAERARMLPAELLTLPSRTDPDERSRLLSRLSSREREVLAFLASGADNLKIAAHLGIRERTVKAHVSSLIRKLERANRTQLALLAIELRVGPPAND